MSKSTSILAATIGIAVVAAVYLWHRPGKEPAPATELGTAPPAGMVALNEVRMQAAGAQVASPTAAPTASSAAAAAPLKDAAAALDIEMRKLNPNYIGVVKDKNAAMQLTYPDLARELNMTPAEAEALYDLLNRQPQGAELDAMLAGRQQQWKEYQTTLDARRRVSELTNMVNTTSPLSEQQSQQLVATVVAEQQRRANELKLLGTPANTPLAKLEFEEATFKAREESNRRAVEASRAYLTEQQVTIMQNAIEGANRMTRVTLANRRAQLEGRTGAAGP